MRISIAVLVIGILTSNSLFAESVQRNETNCTAWWSSDKQEDSEVCVAWWLSWVTPKNVAMIGVTAIAVAVAVAYYKFRAATPATVALPGPAVAALGAVVELGGENAAPGPGGSDPAVVVAAGTVELLRAIAAPDTAAEWQQRIDAQAAAAAAQVAAAEQAAQAAARAAQAREQQRIAAAQAAAQIIQAEVERQRAIAVALEAARRESLIQAQAVPRQALPCIAGQGSFAGQELLKKTPGK